jgi:hypothetical protein
LFRLFLFKEVFGRLLSAQHKRGFLAGFYQRSIKEVFGKLFSLKRFLAGFFLKSRV